MKITFCWAAQIVTWSCYLIETGDTKFLVDCGMFQGPKEISKKNYEPFLFDPKTIDYIFLTHAHIDHSWLIPKMRKKWFKWEVFTTSATIDMCKILFEDSANIQAKNIYRENKRRERMWEPPREPLYSEKDAKDCMQLFKQKIKYKELTEITNNISVRYQDAWHIIWSASIEIFITENNKETKFVFSGDIGQRNAPIIKDPTLIKEADYIFVESTYGNRLHDPIGDRDKKLLECIQETNKRWWKILVPSFAVERTQEFLYSINKLIKQWDFPEQQVFLDSPLAIKATKVFQWHTENFDKEATNKYKHPFSFKQLEMTESVQDSMKLNYLKQPAMIIAGNWMCTAWRIRHHLKHWLWNANNTILFIWYQAEGTTWRHILEWEKYIKMMWTKIIVRAKIKKLNSFSAHADSNELMKRMKWFKNKPQKVFIVHWEQQASQAFKWDLEQIWFNCHLPEIGETLEIK